MRIEWCENKDRQNLLKHKLSLAIGAYVFDDPRHLSIQDRFVDGEERWQTIGEVNGQMLLLVAHTVEEDESEESGSEEVVKLISVRKATLKEKEVYRNGK